MLLPHIMPGITFLPSGRKCRIAITCATACTPLHRPLAGGITLYCAGERTWIVSGGHVFFGIACNITEPLMLVGSTPLPQFFYLPPRWHIYRNAPHPRATLHFLLPYTGPSALHRHPSLPPQNTPVTFCIPGVYNALRYLLAFTTLAPTAFAPPPTTCPFTHATIPTMAAPAPWFLRSPCWIIFWVGKLIRYYTGLFCFL